jgi:hypothetical protein
MINDPRRFDMLNHFMRQIMNANASSFNIAGRGSPSMAGSSATFEGGSDSGADMLKALKQQTFDFGDAMHNRKTRDEIEKLASEVEDSLRAAALVGMITSRSLSDLIKQLHEIADIG